MTRSEDRPRAMDGHGRDNARTMLKARIRAFAESGACTRPHHVVDCGEIGNGAMR